MSAHDSADSEPETVKIERVDAPLNGNPSTNDDTRTSSPSPLSPKLESPPNSDVSTMNSNVGEIVLKQEPGQPAKLSRRSQKVVSRPPPLFNHLPDSTQDALATFEQIPGCVYANKYMGYTEHAMECDCAEEWGKFQSFRVASGVPTPFVKESLENCHCRDITSANTSLIKPNRREARKEHRMRRRLGLYQSRDED
jgi:hypothetical protein